MRKTEHGGARIRGACRMVIAAAAILLAYGSLTAVAAPDKDTWPDRAQPMQVVLVRDARAACAPTCTDWIAAQGKIVPGTAAAFERILRGLGKRRVPVFIDSSGGSVTEAMTIGRRIRAHHLDVVVTRTAIDACAGRKDATCGRGDARRPGRPHGIGALCASACVLVLAAGTARDAAPWTFVGVHQVIMSGIRTQKQRLFRVLTRTVGGVRVEVDRTLSASARSRRRRLRPNRRNGPTTRSRPMSPRWASAQL